MYIPIGQIDPLIKKYIAAFCLRYALQKIYKIIIFSLDRCI